MLPSWLCSQYKNHQGVTSIEYALIAALIAVAIIGALTSTSGSVGAAYDNVLLIITNALN